MGPYQRLLVTEVKLLLRITSAVLLTALAALAGLWLTSPLLLRLILTQALEKQGITVTETSISKPSLQGINIGKLQLRSLEAPIPWNVQLEDAQVSWSFPANGNGKLQLILEVATIDATSDRENIRLTDTDLHLQATIDLESSRLASLTTKIEEATATAGGMNVSGITLPLQLNMPEAGILKLQGNSFSADMVSGPSLPSPVSGITGRFTSVENLFALRQVSLHDLSAQLSNGKLLIPEAWYDVSQSTAAMTLQLHDATLQELAGTRPDGHPWLEGKGSISLPLAYDGRSLVITNGSITCQPGSRYTHYAAEGNPIAIIDLGANPLLDRVNARINLPLKTLDTYTLETFTAAFLGGTISIPPTSFNPTEPGHNLELKFTSLPLQRNLSLTGNFSSSFNARIAGNLPLRIIPSGFEIRNARVSTTGTAVITQKTEGDKTTSNILGKEAKSYSTVTYLVEGGNTVFSRKTDGALTFDITLPKVVRTAGRDKKTFTDLQGSLGMFHNSEHPAEYLVDNFQAGFLGGTISIDHLTWDLQENTTDFVLTVRHIPIQDLITMQGVRQLYTTGTVGGTIPVSVQGGQFAIQDANLSAEEKGTIVYKASPQELSMSQPGLQTTYSALSDFRYTLLSSDLEVAPDGDSTLRLRIEGSNPSFQAGRPVEINLNLRQNLLDLLRSLTISTQIEEALSQ
ncbi:intermembrane phospholipid transport protein YdbH family protein [Prosthecochloris vibrioformis]|uniref:Dicarboxylate transport domain-containing protein n=1 Tax=Prosthecochloris vibrioformis TaxID=1098 RepID=A0A5C4S076_PROVB|nr:YdbH domain-containing protein [Prosthecochloris vibrioformis]TNJ36923.1 hypothetical protein FGF68_04945 [Prosthecochloris vibrioformis]